MGAIVKNFDMDKFLSEVRKSFQQGSIDKECTVFTDLDKVSIRTDYMHTGGCYKVHIFIKHNHASDPNKVLLSFDFGDFSSVSKRFNDINGSDAKPEHIEVSYTRQLTGLLDSLFGKSNVFYTPI